MRTESTDLRVKAIRDHKLVGRGTCSNIDECYEDDDLTEELDEENIKTPEEAVKWALDAMELFLEQGLNQRWGEDDDPQLIEWKEFKKARKEG